MTDVKEHIVQPCYRCGSDDLKSKISRVPFHFVLWGATIAGFIFLPLGLCVAFCGFFVPQNLYCKQCGAKVGDRRMAKRFRKQKNIQTKTSDK